MALIYKATLNPPKLKLLTAWLPSRSWSTGEVDVQQVGAYRFDDPAGEVGIEAFLMQAGDGSVLHVPLTYRGAPLAGAEEFFVGTHRALRFGDALGVRRVRGPGLGGGAGDGDAHRRHPGRGVRRRGWPSRIA